MGKYLKKLLPEGLLKVLRPVYHGILARIACVYFGNPSRNMVVIGITGTAGKSTTIKMLAHILNSFGSEETAARGDNKKICGYVTTVSFFDGSREQINKQGLSMPGGPLLQKYLAKMLANGCKYAIVECTSEGLAQNRHLGIAFAGVALTNLSPAHLDAHGSFENYRKAKGRLFEVPHKFSVVNVDDASADYFLEFAVNRKIGVTGDETKKQFYKLNRVVWYHNLQAGHVLEFMVEQTAFRVPVAGVFNAANAALASAIAEALGVGIELSAKALQSFSGAAGRMEELETRVGFRVFVDYAPEPAAMQAALKAVNGMPHKRILHVFGSTGGHRDVAKRAEFGRISARMSDIIIITNDDVYETDAEIIAQNIQEGISEVLPPLRKVKEVKTILDRKAAIGYALSIAREGDIVIITGKGSEQFLVLPGNKRIEWDEREEVKAALSKNK